MKYQSSAIATAVTVLSVTVYTTLKNVDFRAAVSTLCEELSESPQVTSDLSRDAFTHTNVPEVVLTLGHTHPKAAGARNTGMHVANSMALFMGVKVFSLQMSKSDQRRGFRGSRQWFWSKDTNVCNRQDVQQKDDLQFIGDTDYYMDMPLVLATNVKPTLLYTAVPAAAVTTDEDCTTYFDEEGSLTTLVSGGGKYEHFLWDYGTDSLSVKTTWFGLPNRIVTYAVERKQVSDHRQIILLAPIKVFNGVAAILANYLLDLNPLRRFNPIELAKDGSKFVRFRVHAADGTKVTVARPNSMVCATIKAETDDAIATAARLGTTTLQMPTTASWTGKDMREAAAVLTEYHRISCGKKIPTVFPVEKGVRAFQFEPQHYDPEAKPKMQAFMSPLVHAGFVPVINAAGERQMVKGRIDKYKKRPEPKYCKFTTDCIAEFAEFVSAGVELEPVGYETIAEKQTRPAQILSLLRAVVSGPYLKAILKCFGKAEAYGKVTDPRNISTYNDSDKLEMAQFATALSEHLKRFSWYGPGKNPVQLAQRISDICLVSDNVNLSDLERMDGTITYCLRRVDRAVFMKTFVNHRESLSELLKRNSDNKGVLPNGTTFDQGPTHGSGCSATSVSQTMRKAFTSYLAFRNVKEPRTYSAQQAFDAIGIHNGDDGADGNLPVASLKWACDKVGLILEASVVQRGNPGISFLARYYSDKVWEGSLNSMCDVKRQLSKFHLTVRLPDNVKPEHKLVEKAMSYIATDGNTPVVGAFCKRVLVLSEYRPKTLHGIGSWWSKFDDSVQYPNENVDGWMDVEFERLFPEFDRTIFNDWLVATSTGAEMLEAPLCVEIKPAQPISVDVVVDEQLMLAETVQAPLAIETIPTPVTPPRGPKRDPKRKPTEKQRKKNNTRDKSPVVSNTSRK